MDEDADKNGDQRNYVLGKIGKRPRMRALVEQGVVFMRRLAGFPEIASTVIGDPNEGLFARYPAENPTLKTSVRIGAKTIAIPGASLTVKSSARKHAVYCMCGLVVPGNGSLPGETLMPIARDERNRDFGDTFVIFKNTVEFVRRLENAAREHGYELDSGPIEYVPSVYCGEMGPFRKLDSYAYQSEWRFITTTPIPEDNLTLTLGSLLDIAMWVDLNTIETSRSASG